MLDGTWRHSTLTPFDLHRCEAGVVGRLDVGAVENVPRNVLIVLGPGAFVLGADRSGQHTRAVERVQTQRHRQGAVVVPPPVP